MALSALLLTAALVQVPAPVPDRAAVEAPIQAYFRYHRTGDPQGLVEAFHPAALLQWSEGGQRKILTQADWRASAAAKAAQAKGPRPEVRCEIAWLEVAGEAATAKVVLDYPTFRFIDYLHLLKLEGRWAIVDKVYHREDRPAR